MKFNEFSAKTDIFTSKPLGGMPSQFKLVPKLRLKFNEETIKQRNPKVAAVLALCFPNKNNETCFLLTERASYKGTHSAQISFPGGKKEQSDINLEYTSLRETEEEIGISKNDVKIVRQLSDTYIPPSNFMVTPFLGLIENTPNFKPNYEVEKTIVIKLSDLLDDKNIANVVMNTSYMKNIEVPCFKLNNHIVWGATAMILSEIKDLVKPA